MTLSQPRIILPGTSENDLPSGPYRDSFGRFRTSNPHTLFDSKQLYTAQTLLWDDAAVSGTGTSSTYSSARASSTLGVSNTTAGVRARQSLRWFNYQPGKSHLGMFTAVFGAAATGITRRAGYFETNNGLYFEQLPSGIGVVVRSKVSGSVVNTRVAQADWNIDRLDGMGRSNQTLDITKAQIFAIDFEWLGTGSIRFGFVIDGVLYYCHQFRHANNITSVYMSTPNLPIRFELTNDGTGPAATLECICAAVVSEGGREAGGIDFAVDRAATPLTTLNDASIYPLLAIQLRSGFEGTYVSPFHANVVCTSTATFRYAIIANPTVTGTALSFTGVTNSGVQADVGTTNATTITGGTVLFSSYAQAQKQGEANLTIPVDYTIGSKIDGTRDVLVLAVQRVSGTTEPFYGSLAWHERV